MAKHHRKLYGPSDFKDEENFLKVQMSAVASLAAATAKEAGKSGNVEAAQRQLNEIIEVVSRVSQKEKIARERGVQGSTNRGQELFEMVMSTISNGHQF